jgi:hypothetical protein
MGINEADLRDVTFYRHRLGGIERGRKGMMRNGDTADTGTRNNGCDHC